jgi:predicted transcriptional regulator
VRCSFIASPSSIDGLSVWLSTACYANDCGEGQQAPAPGRSRRSCPMLAFACPSLSSPRRRGSAKQNRRLALLAPEIVEASQSYPARRAIASDHLVCLACGKKQKLLKRHLSTEHALTPEQYRSTFELRPDYPMVAPNYAKQRRELALKIGLGRPKKPAPKPRRKTAARSRAKASGTAAPAAGE